MRSIKVGFINIVLNSGELNIYVILPASLETFFLTNFRRITLKIKPT